MIGYLFDLWSWADDFSETGELFGISEQDLDDEIGLPGFADALRKVGWLEGRNASLSLPNYAEHNGQSAKRRCQESKRISELRKSNASNAEKCTHAMRTKSVPEKRREEFNPLTPSQGESSSSVRKRKRNNDDDDPYAHMKCFN